MHVALNDVICADFAKLPLNVSSIQVWLTTIMLSFTGAVAIKGCDMCYNIQLE